MISSATVIRRIFAVDALISIDPWKDFGFAAATGGVTPGGVGPGGVGPGGIGPGPGGGVTVPGSGFLMLLA